MHPVLFELGPLTLHSYGAGVGTALLLGMWTASKLTEGDPRWTKDFFWFAALLTVPLALLGARLEYVRQHWSEGFGEDLASIFMITDGGVVFHGGLVGGAIGLALAVWLKKAPLLPTLDAAAVTVGYGLVFARLGCFGAGCCYGDATDLPWGVVFSHPDSIAPGDLARHPTQLYAAIFGAILGPVLTLKFLRRRFDGQVAVTLGVLYPVFRIVNEILRGDGERGWLIEGVLTPAQGFSLAAVALSLTAGFVLARRASSSSPSPG